MMIGNAWYYARPSNDNAIKTKKYKKIKKAKETVLKLFCGDDEFLQLCMPSKNPVETHCKFNFELSAIARWEYSIQWSPHGDGRIVDDDS